MRSIIPRPPVLDDEYSSLLHALCQLQLDDAIRAQGTEIVNVIDFTLVYRYAFERNVAVNFIPLREFFEGTSERCVIIPYSQIELNRIYTTFDRAVHDPKNWDRIKDLSEKPETKEFVRVYHQMLLGRSRIPEVLEAYRELLRNHPGPTKSAVFVALLRDDIIDPTDRILKMVTGRERPFVAYGQIEQDLETPVIFDASAFLRLYRSLQGSRYGKAWTASNVTDAQVQAWCVAANMAQQGNRRQFFFRNVTTGAVADIFNRDVYDLTFGRREFRVSLSRDLSIVLWERVVASDRAQELRELIRELQEYLELGGRTPRGGQGRASVEDSLARTSLALKIQRNFHEKLVDAVDLGVATCGMWWDEGDWASDLEAGKTDLHQVGQLYRLMAMFSQVHQAGSGYKQELQEQFRQALKSLVSTLEDQAGGEERWLEMVAEYDRLRTNFRSNGPAGELQEMAEKLLEKKADDPEVLVLEERIREDFARLTGNCRLEARRLLGVVMEDAASQQKFWLALWLQQLLGEEGDDDGLAPATVG